MAKRIAKTKVLVVCADCTNSIRDTEGISVNEHGEFFMCKCKKGHSKNKYGQLAKLFIDEKRECDDFHKRLK